jgi:mono/diheme cytochrome c family protein
MKSYTLLCTAFLFLLTLSFCGTARRGEPLYKPVDVENEQVARGEVVYMRYCDKCHPGGESGLATAINDKPVPGFVIRFQIRNGLGAMPAFKSDVIPVPELDDLMAYIKQQRKAKDKPESTATANLRP